MLTAHRDPDVGGTEQRFIANLTHSLETTGLTAFVDLTFGLN